MTSALNPIQYKHASASICLCQSPDPSPEPKHELASMFTSMLGSLGLVQVHGHVYFYSITMSGSKGDPMPEFQLKDLPELLPEIMPEFMHKNVLGSTMFANEYEYWY